MTWNKQHDGADLDTDIHRLRADPLDAKPRMVEVPEDYLIALEARAVRQSAILHASRDRTDGVVDQAVLPLIAAAAQVYPHHVMRAVDRLCDVKLLKRLPKRQGDGWEIRNFLKYNPSKQQQERTEATSANHDWLHKTSSGKRVKALVERRDGKWCRYCAIEFSAKDGDRRGPFRKTFDFVDPDLPFDRSKHASLADLEQIARNIVLACGYCNAVKNRRTPDQAEMVLLDPPGLGRPDLSRSIREQVAGDPRPGQSVGTGLAGSERIGSALEHGSHEQDSPRSHPIGFSRSDVPPPHTDADAPPEVHL